MQNGTFRSLPLICPISAPACALHADRSGSNFNPRNIQYIYPKGIYYVAPVVDPPEADRLPPLKVRDLRLELE
ncbi:MAG: hypothetical protein JRD71_03540 [Deltaproteobacteria bacterium]|nr:hypothetical protein [Deltaproteobacteria bacterium]